MLIHGASGGVSILKRQVIKMGFSVLVSAFFFFTPFCDICLRLYQ